MASPLRPLWAYDGGKLLLTFLIYHWRILSFSVRFFMARGSFQFSGRVVHDGKFFLGNLADEASGGKTVAEVENERRGEKFGLPSRPSEIIKYPAGKKIQLQRERSIIRQLFQDPFYPIIGFAACQDNFGQIKIFLILPKEVFGG
jgi:hypothetical protein